DTGGPVVRRMVKGFYLALDTEFKDNRKLKWWKNTEGFVAPFDRVYVNHTASDFHGVWMNTTPPEGLPTAPGNPPNAQKPEAPFTVKEPTHLPVGFILWRGHRYTLSPDKKTVAKGDPIERWTRIPLTGHAVRVGGSTYEETEEGWWMRASEG